MVRSALAVLTLTVLPGFVAAQQPAETASRMHTVVKTETLWGLAQRYYQDPFAWPRIYEANRGQVQDPNLIYPDWRLVIPGVAASTMAGEPAGEEGPAVVGGVSVSGGGAPSPMAPGDETEPSAELSERDRRSVFFRDPVTTLGVRGIEQEDYLLVSRASVWSAEWLGPENTDRIRSTGMVASFVPEGELRTAVPYTRVRLKLSDGASVSVGDALQIFRPARSVEGVGSILRPSGVMSITKTDNGIIEGVVLQLFERVLPGDLVRPAPVFDLEKGDYPDVVSSRTTAKVLEFGATHALYSLGDIAILDQGGDQGVAIGDEYVAFDGDGRTEEVVGRLRVVATEGRTASARIVAAKGPVFRKGIAVHLDRKMR